MTTALHWASTTPMATHRDNMALIGSTESNWYGLRGALYPEFFLLILDLGNFSFHRSQVEEGVGSFLWDSGQEMRVLVESLPILKKSSTARSSTELI